MPNVFSNIPFFRIIIPFIAGILLGIYLDLDSPAFIFLMLPITVAIVTLFKKGQNVLTKRIYLICLDTFLFLFALHLVQINTLKDRENYYGKYYKPDKAGYFIATINDIPVEKEKFIKCSLIINEIKNDSNYIKTQGKIIAYFKRSEREEVLKPGTTLVIKTKLIEVSASQNPFEFDYKNYLYNKQVYHTAFL